jgi:MYXO-CTERM domain-containing protein
MRRRCVRALCSAFLFAVTGLSSTVSAAELQVERSEKHQTIEGFGFFGGADVWWGTNESVLNPEWAAKMIDDLGLTIWRNEYYPDRTEQAPQDADWEKQKPVVQAFVEAAQRSHVPLKVLLTVWTPPAQLKCMTDDGRECRVPIERPANTKGGNILDPAERAAFAEWLKAGLKLYADLGVDVYGLSFQNEPFFWQPYNSCFYAQDAYVPTLAFLSPRLRADYPKLKLFGAENMLAIECGAGANKDQFDEWWYTGLTLRDEAALAATDAWAVHGYTDGVAATPTSTLARLWSAYREGVAATKKPIWMTETSGYSHAWEPADKPGALDLGQAILAALVYGDVSAWVYWQGSRADAVDEYSLMTALTPGKNYFVSKQFYRYIRPGATRITVKSNDSDLLAVAFEHASMKAFTTVVINVGEAEKTVDLMGSGVPSRARQVRTSASEDALDLGEVSTRALKVPARSIVTLVDGNVYETQSSSPGTGDGGAGNPSDPGAAGDAGNGPPPAGGPGSGPPEPGAAGSASGASSASRGAGCNCSLAAAPEARHVAMLASAALLGLFGLRRRALSLRR